MKLIQSVSPDAKILYCGDIVRFKLQLDEPLNGKAYLRTNIGKAAVHYREITQHVEKQQAIMARDWYDIPMKPEGKETFTLTLALNETGTFSAKVWFLEENSKKPLWPAEDNFVFKVEPARNVGANTIYSVFVRQFGSNMYKAQSNTTHSDTVANLDKEGYTVIPPSGTFRSVIKQLDFIINTLNSQIIQLLPIHTTPTVYGRMGRFGSAFAPLDYFSVDPALAEFDQKTTPLGQFIELVDAVHSRDARIFMDIPVNHTGWASCLHSQHPDWFVKDKDDTFVSPGAWGIVWSDLSELDYSKSEVSQYMADVFLYWLRLGVDGFRCDAGYKLPSEAWEYINAKIRLEYPDAVLLLEGLGGLLEKQELLLKTKGLNWAYSELFQNYNREQIENYFGYCDKINREAGLMIHYAETHDNNRLATVSKSHSKMRTALSALLSYNGSFGITNGVEWLASEKVDVHGASALNWGNENNIGDHIRRLQILLIIHPLFYNRSTIKFINKSQSNSLVFIREAKNLEKRLLILINLDGQATTVQWSEKDFPIDGLSAWDLLTGQSIPFQKADRLISLSLKAEQVFCLTSDKKDLQILETALSGNKSAERTLWQKQRLQAEILKIIGEYEGMILHHNFNIGQYTDLFENDPKQFWKKVSGTTIPSLTRWIPGRDEKRIVILPREDLLLIESIVPFRAEIKNGEITGETIVSLPVNGKYFAAFRKISIRGDLPESRKLNVILFEKTETQRISGELLLLPDWRKVYFTNTYSRKQIKEKNIYTIASDELGGMSQIRASWGSLHSKYDAILAANCHQDFPVDRRVMFTRCRAWLVHNDYSQEINLSFLDTFISGAGNQAQWNFKVPVGQGKLVELTIKFEMASNGNRVRFTFIRLASSGNDSILEEDVTVKLILRPDIEDRVNHEVTKAYNGPENLFPSAVQANETGFIFSPYEERALKIEIAGSQFVSQPEWKYMEFLKEENERGLEDNTDLFSPGYFQFHLNGNDHKEMIAMVYSSHEKATSSESFNWPAKKLEAVSEPETAMKNAMKHFIVKRDQYKTVIAGYPWFLDWGRDTLIALRGMISAGYLKECEDIIIQFAVFEKDGTIPNVIRGEDDSNRETSDAPLWLFIAVEDYIREADSDKILYKQCGNRTLVEVLESILTNYRSGTPNGIIMDTESGLIFSPAHYTWMDTNYPAGTPREGYAVEIQALWASALRFISRYRSEWKELYKKVVESIEKYFWLDKQQYLADCLHTTLAKPASEAERDDACRPNQLFAVTFDILKDNEKKKRIISSCEQLLIPGAIRTLADKPVSRPLPVYNDGQLLNNPNNPYWGRYEGDEDTRRKPAYHNGTAWTWPFPSYIEALYLVSGKEVQNRALSMLLSSKHIIEDGCAGQIPEVLDGDTPHKIRGCGAQAWGVTEFYRIYKLLKN